MNEQEAQSEQVGSHSLDPTVQYLNQHLDETSAGEQIVLPESVPVALSLQTKRDAEGAEVDEFIPKEREEVVCFQVGETTLIDVGPDEALFITPVDKTLLVTQELASCVGVGAKMTKADGSLVIGQAHLYRPNAPERFAELLSIAQAQGLTLIELMVLLENRGSTRTEEQVVEMEQAVQTIHPDAVMTRITLPEDVYSTAFSVSDKEIRLYGNVPRPVPGWGNDMEYEYSERERFTWKTD